MTPTVSVLLSVHNGEPHLTSSLASILAQSLREIEIIVVDDGSTDKTSEILRKFSRVDERMKVIRSENNIGLAAALNLGLAEARGEFVARMDADDIALPDRLLVQLAWFEKADPLFAVLGTGRYVINEAGNLLKTIRPETNLENIHRDVRIASPLAHSTVMFRRSAVVEVGGYRSVFKKAQDYDLWLRLVEAGRLLANLEMPLVKYRTHPGAATRRDFRMQALCHAVARLASRQRIAGRKDPIDNCLEINEDFFFERETLPLEKRTYLLDLLRRIRSYMNFTRQTQSSFYEEVDRISLRFFDVETLGEPSLDEVEAWWQQYKTFSSTHPSAAVFKRFAAVTGGSSHLSSGTIEIFRQLKNNLPEESETAVQNRETGTRVFLVGGEGIGWALDEDLRLLQNAVRQANHIDLVHDESFADIIHSVYLRRTAKFDEGSIAGKKVVTSLSGDIKRFLHDDDLFPLAVRKTSMWSVYSDNGFGQLSALNLPVARLNYMVDIEVFRPLGIEARDPEELRARYGIPKDAYLIGSFQRDSGDKDLGKPKWVKGPDRFANIVSQALRKGVPIHVILAGPRRHWLRAKLRELSVPFTFIGTEVLGDDLRLNTLDRNVLNTLYNLIDLYLIASRSEGGPHALFEACASKCKIISSRVGASEDVLEPYAIFDTDHEAAELINLDHKQNVLAKSLDRNLQIVRDGYSVAAVSQFLPQFYSQVLEAHHSEEADLTGAEFSENLPLPASLRVVRRDQTKSHQAVAVPNGDRNEDLSDKIRNVEALFEANPNDIKLIKELVDHYEAAGRLNSALSAISLAVLTDDVNQQLQYRRSLLLGKLGRRTEALEIALELVKCQPSNSQFQRHLSNLLLHCERIDEALEAAGNAAILDPFNASNYFHFARLLFDSGKVAEAIVAAEQASRADPIDHRIYNLIAEAAEHHGDLEKAKRALAVAHKLAPRGTSYEARLKNLEATEVPSL